LSIYTLDPLQDPRWTEFVGRHRFASVVHTTGWLRALNLTYGYTPVVYTTSGPAAPLTNGAVFCRIKSWLTGRRLVSLPFTDHCELLVDGPEQESELLNGLQEAAAREKLKYVELRPRDMERPTAAGWDTNASFRFHQLDLRPSLDDLYRAAHKTAIQQAIRRADREKLGYDEGCSEKQIAEFYRLLLLTRRRHKLPPQPIAWFRNLASCLGDGLTIRVASKDGETIASILTLHWKGEIFYKYGCSDARFHNLGGMAFLLWKTIQEAKQTGAHALDFGRSDLDNTGLITFKDRWGAQPSSLHYFRHSATPQRRISEGGRARLLQQSFALMPDKMLTAAGRLLYRHIG
jgi:hypothetical protein